MDRAIIRRIEDLLIKNGKTKSDLASATNLTYSSVYSWFLKTGNAKGIRTKNLEKIAQFLGVTSHYLRTGEYDLEDSNEKNITSFDRIYYPVLKDNSIIFEPSRIHPFISTLKDRFKLQSTNITVVSFSDEAMSPVIMEDDLLIIDNTLRSDINEHGYYLLGSSDGVMIRRGYKDGLTKQYYLSSCDLEKIVMKYDVFHETFTSIYKIIGLQRTF